VKPCTAIARIATGAALLVGAATACAQLPWQLDPTFRTEIVTENVNSLAILPNGQLLISGRINFTQSPLADNWSTMRLNADGSRDELFPQWPLSSAGGGKIIPWQDRFYIKSGSMVRALSNGLNDAQFNMIDAQYVVALQLEDFHVYPDGSLVVVGDFALSHPQYTGYYNVVWITATGAFDPNRPPRAGNANIVHINQQPDGKFILSGSCNYWEGTPTAPTFRVHPDGSLDTSFQCPFGWGEMKSTTVLPDGRILASGLFKTSFSSTDSLHFVRMMPDGSIDPTFNNDMEVIRQTWGPPLWPNMPINWGQFTIVLHQVLSDGRIAILGSYQTIDGHLKRGIGLLDPDGNWLEEPLGSAGCGQFPYSAGTGDIDYLYNDVTGLFEAPDGYIYIWGAYKGYDDGTTNDPAQAFVTRLYGLNVGMAERERILFTLYPNPASTQLTVQFEQMPQQAEWVLRDALGRVVLRERVATYQHTLGLHGLGSGVYLLELWSKGQRVGCERVVVE
jgi:uncharacterized delta-60 repeat protein